MISKKINNIAIFFPVVLLFVFLKLGGGIHSDQTFHITGLYKTLREVFFVPDIFSWNFRLITYKLYLSLLSIIPFNVFGISNISWMSIIAIHYACFFSLIIYLSKDKVNKTNAALGILVVMVNNKWSVLSADEVAAMISVLSVCYYDKFKPDLKYFIPIVSNAIFFVKGISVFMFLPVLYVVFFDSKNTLVTTKKLIIPILMSFFLFVLIVSSTSEMQYLMTAKLFQNNYLSFGLDFSVIFNNLYSPLTLVVVTLFLVCRTDKKWVLCFIVFILSVMIYDGLQNKSWSYHSSGYFIALCLLCFKSREIKLNHYIIISVLIIVEALVRGTFFEPDKIYDRHGNARGGSGLSNWRLEQLPDVNDSEKLLYLTYGTDYSRFGYPFECGFFSAHYIQRVNHNQLINSMYLTDYYECTMSYNGKYIIYNSKWMKLKKNKHKELLDKICSEYGVLESNKKVLIRGGKDKSHCN